MKEHNELLTVKAAAHFLKIPRRRFTPLHRMARCPERKLRVNRFFPKRVSIFFNTMEQLLTASLFFY